ncbi:MAG: tryptophan--tRNA ligase [Candidatus Aquicultor secundus]|uniref:Tryptophan--tRNA ligase n=1 Tax=Candidatus Aquicultor secundus TaxID=1973895 RepID=A0A2M7T5E8_9ACTN|nr:tryptophan--tRNA ligase [Candidatus Aquicultor secundus]NCO65473.1 tryptophan--tRNA ligase [Solirubrobacter sp.]OIO88410.1 MAG: tryptophan--tRNA ligase [Candidatus Aquicultor secundus]PIU27109.1 MAG: tryptophan--tRNA ligase [Candidatus Aquicultor secundus]PIW21813.1 MAG: tryptophan--tRNA ligase [Candidatus Aquicultor secundus]PIX52773.1 MAG: tryptophan--tRNA ligase [Candidatus Aquicultor secundus]
MTKRVVSGQRPTGRLHLGHYFGTLQNWVRLQDQYQCLFFVADWHALTTKFDDVGGISEDTREMVIDWLAVGLDPKKCFIYKQSDIPEVAELFVYLTMITPVSWLERNPTYKEMLREITSKDIQTAGFLSYPVLQTADIILPKGNLVPVGEDQLPHLELGREIVRRFNFLYGDYFDEPEALLSPVKRLLGIDGRKMSKSYGNSIFLSDDPDTIRAKVNQMITDPARQKKTDPGSTEACMVVYPTHHVYSSNAELQEIETKCHEAAWGCMACKRELADKIIDSLAGFRERRAEIEKEPGIVNEVLREGLHQVRPICRSTIHDVRSKLNIFSETTVV